MTQFNFVDSPMGAGKTTALFSKLNNEYQKHDNKRYICIVLYKTEQNRYKEALKETLPKIPKDGQKIDDIVKLIAKGENIITTHALFDRFDDNVIDSIKNSQYVYDLFIDEQPTVLHDTIGGSNKKYANSSNDKLNDINSLDLSLAISNNIILKTDNSKYIWNDENPYNKYNKGLFLCLKQHLSQYDVYMYTTKTENILISITKIDIFTCFNQVWVLSYLIKDSLLENYFNFYNITDFNYYHVENNSFIEGYKKAYPNIDRLKLEPSEYCFDKSLSRSQYYSFNKNDFKELLLHFYRAIKRIQDNNKSGTLNLKQNYYFTAYKQSIDNFNTALKENKKSIRIAIKDCLIPCNTKGTNAYQDRQFVGYLVDRHVNPVFANFFNNHDITVDKELYSLSELIQFIWRSNIRDESSTKPVYVYLAGKQTHNLFTKFIEECNEYKN